MHDDDGYSSNHPVGVIVIQGGSTQPNFYPRRRNTEEKTKTFMTTFSKVLRTVLKKSLDELSGDKLNGIPSEAQVEAEPFVEVGIYANSLTMSFALVVG